MIAHVYRKQIALLQDLSNENKVFLLPKGGVFGKWGMQTGQFAFQNDMDPLKCIAKNDSFLISLTFSSKIKHQKYHAFAFAWGANL